MTDRDAIIASIGHHKRIRDWAKSKKDQSENYCHDEMKLQLGECLGQDYCALCDEFFSDCGMCPLGKKYGPCSYSDNNLYHTKVASSETYGQLVVAEDLFIPQLESLLEDYPEEERKDA